MKCNGTTIEFSGDPWDEWDNDETMVDLGGGMIVPLRELMEEDE